MGSSKQPYRGMYETYRETYRAHGIRRFYRGLGNGLARKAHAVYLSMTVARLCAHCRQFVGVRLQECVLMQRESFTGSNSKRRVLQRLSPNCCW